MYLQDLWRTWLKGLKFFFSIGLFFSLVAVVAFIAFMSVAVSNRECKLLLLPFPSDVILPAQDPTLASSFLWLNYYMFVIILASIKANPQWRLIALVCCGVVRPHCFGLTRSNSAELGQLLRKIQFGLSWRDLWKQKQCLLPHQLFTEYTNALKSFWSDFHIKQAHFLSENQLLLKLFIIVSDKRAHLKEKKIYGL